MMFKKVSLKYQFLFLLFLCFHFGEAANAFTQLPYDTASIPMDLKKGANSIKRIEKIEVDIVDVDKVNYHMHKAVTIFDSKGSYELYFKQYTDKFISLESVDIRIFDATGKLLSKYSKKDLISQADGEGLVEDGKTYFLKIVALSYPLTIETDLEMRFKGLYRIPVYQISQPYQAVIQSSYWLRYPENIEFSSKSYVIELSPKKEKSDGKNVLTWEVLSLPAKKYEENSGPWNTNYPHVLFISNKIKYDGYAGNMSSWKDMGLWYNSLVTKINVLSDPHKLEIRQLVSGAASDVEKISILYAYLQKNFRYVSIQLGIGGFRPFPADFVHTKKYGDCKALSNYMEACLEAVGIKSYSAWINAGQDKPAVDPSFPYDAFNHQILCVPLPKDTIWLECTSNYNDFGHLGNFTENRYALLLTEQGGVLVKTPTSKPEQNIYRMNTVVELMEDGSGTLTGALLASGNYKYDQILLSLEKKDIQKSYLVNQLGYINPDLFDISVGEKYLTPIQTQLNMEFEKIPDFISGSKMFIRPRMYTFWNITLAPTEKRLYDYLFECPFERSDTTRFVLPEGFVVESLPNSIELSFSYGIFLNNYWYEEKSRTIFSTAVFRLNNYRIPPEKYQETREFIEKMKVAEGKKLIIKKV